MKKIIQIYNNIIIEQNNLTKIILPSNIYYFNFISFKPFIYNNVSIFQSAFHEDINHVLNRLNERKNIQKKYSLNDIFVIIKRGINEYKNQLKAGQIFKAKQSFHIISKSYSDIKIACSIEKNFLLNELVYLDASQDNILYHSQYFCFIYTILTKHMQKFPLDKELFVENCNDIINLYIE